MSSYFRKDRPLRKAANAQSAQSTLLICAPSTRPLSFDALEKALKDWQTAQVVITPDFEAATRAAEAAAGRPLFVLVAISANKDLVELVKFLTALRPKLDKREVAVLCLNQFNHPKVPVILKSQGCGEILSYDCHVRLLARKLSLGVEALERIHLQATKDGNQRAGGFGTGLLGRKNTQASKEATFVDPIDLPSDCWLVDEQKAVRCVMGRWSVAFVGAGPSAGTWKPMDNGQNEGLVWQWMPKDENGVNAFVSEPGRWVFEGREPEFDWKFNIWRFVGQKPSLYFLRDNGNRHYRMRFDASGLQIARNSKVAESKRPWIMQSVEASMRIRQAEIAAGKLHEAHEDRPVEKAGLELRLDPETHRAWNDLGTQNDDGDSAGWNSMLSPDGKKATPGTDGDLTPDLAPDWNRGDIRHEKNGGRGLGQGQGGSKGYYYDDEFATGADAFVRLAFEIELPDYGARADIVEMGAGYALLEVFTDAPFALGEKTSLAMVLMNKSAHASQTASNRVEIQAMVAEIEPIDEKSVLVKFATKAEHTDKMQELYSVFEKRQEQAQQFLTLARGY